MRLRRRLCGARSIDLFWASWAFVFAAGLVWYSVNGAAVAKPEGFDPYRYEYFAREGLPEGYLLASGYRIVILLQWIYQFLPVFFGFSVFCGALHCSLVMTVRNRTLLIALFNPITFYYIGQTGKDGIAILAFAASAMIATPGAPRRQFAAYMVIAIALVLRPPIGIFLLPIYLLFRRGVSSALLASIGLACGFLVISNQADIADSLLELVTRDDESDITQPARDFTFGIGVDVVAIRLALYLLSIFFQPFVGLGKFASSWDFFLLYEAIIYFLMLFYVAKMKLIRQFLLASLPFVVLVATIFPFYHFRYLVVSYPLVLAFVLGSTAPKRGRRKKPLHGIGDGSEHSRNKDRLNIACTSG